MALERKKVTGTTPRDIANINANMETMWYKMFGNLNLGDINQEFLDKVLTQYVTVQGEGNLDSTHPLYIRFYIPPNTKKLKAAPMNIMLSRYRMDSSITEGGGQITGGRIAMSTEESSVSVSVSGGQQVDIDSDIHSWGGVSAPTTRFPVNNNSYQTKGYFKYGYSTGVGGFSGLMVTAFDNETTDNGKAFIDLYDLQHRHRASMPAHTHTVNIEPHTHEGYVSLNIDPHSHNLKEGIHESIVNPTGIRVYVNDTAVGNILSGDGTVVNDLDIVDNLLIGSWNTIRVISQSVSRITIYGIIELVSRFNVR